jgi:hypothetical protein
LALRRNSYAILPLTQKPPRTRRKAIHSNGKVPPMGIFTKDIKTFDDLFLHQLQDIYYAEKQIVK